MNKQQRYQEKNKHPCAKCCARVLKNSKLCQRCDRNRRRTEMSKRPLRLRHGFSKRPEHYIWQSMIQRCKNPNAKQYADYGGRGIRVCARWLVFDNFLADMGRRPPGKHSSGRALYTLERKNGNGHYTKKNCLWATYKDQARNKRRMRMVVYRGKRLQLATLVERFGGNYKIVHQRIARGWSVEHALTGAP